MLNLASGKVNTSGAFSIDALDVINDQIKCCKCTNALCKKRKCIEII